MYPNLYYFFKDVLGISLPVFKLVNTFGFFMALGFLVAAWLLSKELRRKQRENLFTCTETTVVVGEHTAVSNLLPAFLWGYLTGYKLLGLLLTPHALNRPQHYLFSSEGSILYGLLCGLVFAAWKWWRIKARKQVKPEPKTIKVWPADRVAVIAIIAAVTGLIGAKIFDNLENWDRFVKDPIGNLFSGSGLTFYGGLIFATLALWYYMRKKKIPFIHVCDAAAPALMIAYCIGRMGCQVAGDGDWGIINSAYLTYTDGNLAPSDPGKLDTAIAMYGEMYIDKPGQAIERKYVKAFAGLPGWLFAYSYPHNINKQGIGTANCTFDEYCNHLPLPVFPTSLYEVIMAFLLFVLLWALRKRIRMPGLLFAIYLVTNGIERLLIEQIRVNTKYSIFGLYPTQAEIISSLLIAGGIFLYWYAPRIKLAPINAGDAVS